MSLPRSVDMTDLGGASVTVSTSSETLVLTGPRLQTPKETSFVLTIGFFAITVPSTATSVVARIRSGASVTGTQLGQSYSQSMPAGISVYAGFAVATQQVQASDYVQNSLTVQQTAATTNGTVTGATVWMISW